MIMKRSSLKNGMIVEFRNGDTAEVKSTYWGTQKVMILKTNEGLVNIKLHYTETLRRKGSRKLDIINVYTVA